MTHKRNNRVALITGASSGIGLELTKRLLSEGWQVLALIRSAFPSGDSLVQDCIMSQQLRIYTADLSDFTDLQTSLNQIKKHEEHIDLLFNNAGVSFGQLSYSKQGREMHFEVNSVVPYIILMEMKELLARGSFKTVINTSSNALLYLKRFDYTTLASPTVFKKLVGPYAASKLALSLWTQEIANSIQKDGIMIRSVCPGANKTTITNNAGMPKFMIPIRHLFFSHPSEGASRLYEAAIGSSPQSTGVFLNKGKVTPLKFSSQSTEVLGMVERIYRQEFTALS
ncbi:SDR family NAD(P)-dependent oxidoreductase [Paenibacillus sp. JZ16]|uniref:SDR family NAD(P)-dependent oxidoreductase n=1 Tax=Paenibacillus sp. JZ16 TaxID=1906272 RepID=UPI00188DBEF8|nr:SDR family NAD(P)-dependent oxidoreductase [Paenibacillus sp. JZ16]